MHELRLRRQDSPSLGGARRAAPHSIWSIAFALPAQRVVASPMHQDDLHISNDVVHAYNICCHKNDNYVVHTSIHPSLVHLELQYRQSRAHRQVAQCCIVSRYSCLAPPSPPTRFVSVSSVAVQLVFTLPREYAHVNLNQSINPWSQPPSPTAPQALWGVCHRRRAGVSRGSAHRAISHH